MDKKTLIKCIGDALELDYEFISTGTGSVFLRLKGEGFEQSIVFSYRKYPGVCVLADYLYGWKALDPIEKILRRYYNKYNLGFQHTTIHVQTRWKSELSKIEIQQESDITKAIPYLREMVYEDILPFFEKYQTVEQVYKEMESLEKSKIANFIFHPPTIRMMIIKRLVNDPKWEEFAFGVINNYKKWSEEPNGAAYKPFAQFLPELFKELKEMEV